MRTRPTCPNHPDRPSALESAHGFCSECRRDALKTTAERQEEVQSMTNGAPHEGGAK